MNLNGISPHEPEEELIGPEELGVSVRNLERAVTHNRLRNLINDLDTDAKINQLLHALIRMGVWGDEKEIITRALETLFIAVTPPIERERILNH